MNARFLPSLIIATLLFASCQKYDVTVPEQPRATSYSSDIATEWMYTLQKVVQDEGSNPPVASRIYAYSAIALYEAVLPSMQGYQTLEGQIPGLQNLPDSRMYGKLDPVATANETMFLVINKVFPALKTKNQKLIKDLYTKYYEAAFRRVPSEEVYNSAAFGKAVATAVLNRANNDGYSSSRGLSYSVPSPTLDPSFWSPTNTVVVPLEPFWSQVKCFAMAEAGACTIKSTIPFSTTPGSPFYTQAYEVYAASNALTNDQKDIARWWSDGSSQTATPPGHWVNIVDQLSRRNSYDLGRSAEIYAMVNIAMADAFISCWDEKYKQNLLRPVTYMRNYVAGATTWTPLLPTPPFPEYPSGHSVASAAAGDILTTLLGNVSFTDSANVYLGYPPRSYNSFTEAASEAAISRLYGGIHFREAIEKGSLQGKEVAKVVLQKIKLRK